MDATLSNLIRIANIDVKLNSIIGDGETALGKLAKEDYQAVFVATGRPSPRALSFEGKLVAGGDLEGVMLGLNLLLDVSQKKVCPRLFERKLVIVIGGGGVAFDAARTARRLGGKVAVVCLENEDKSSKDEVKTLRRGETSSTKKQPSSGLVNTSRNHG